MKGFTEDYLLHDVRMQTQLLQGDVDWILRLAGEKSVVAGDSDITEIVLAMQSNIQAACSLLTVMLESSSDKKEAVALPYALRKVYSVVLHNARAKRMEMHLDIGAEPVVLVSDAKLQRMLYNLFSNAIRHASANAKVTARVLEEDGRAAVEIANEGSPLGQGVIDVLEGRLAQGDEMPSGMGIYVIRRLADEMGCDVRAWNAQGRNAIRVIFPGKMGG